MTITPQPPRDDEPDFALLLKWPDNPRETTIELMRRMYRLGLSHQRPQPKVEDARALIETCQSLYGPHSKNVSYPSRSAAQQVRDHVMQLIDLLGGTFR